MTVNEYRVRPVIRWNLTHHESRTLPNGMASGSTRSLGEFASEQQANEAREMYERASAEQQFAVVSVGFDSDALVVYAYSDDEARALQAKLQFEHGREFRIFSRPKHDFSRVVI